MTAALKYQLALDSLIDTACSLSLSIPPIQSSTDINALTIFYRPLTYVTFHAFTADIDQLTVFTWPCAPCNGDHHLIRCCSSFDFLHHATMTLI